MFKRLLPLYLISALALHIVTWYTYGGFSRKDHPPIWDVEEFLSAAGVKFLVFALVSAVLYQIYLRLRPLVNSMWWLIVPGMLLFVVCTAYLENQVLSLFDWTTMLGGRSQTVMYFLAALFGALQIAMVAYAKATELVKQEIKSEKLPEANTELVLKRNNYEYTIPARELSYAEAFGNFTKVIVDGDTYLYGKGIGKLMEELPEESFIRIHRSYLIQTNKVAQVRKKSKAVTVILEDGTELPVGPSKRQLISSL